MNVAGKTSSGKNPAIIVKLRPIPEANDNPLLLWGVLRAIEIGPHRLVDV